VPGVAMDRDTVFEIMSITKILTALLLTDMAQRGEVAFDDPLAKYLPSSVTLHATGRPVTLLDLATYRSGLPNMPGGLAPDWYQRPNPLRDYTQENLHAFLSGMVPKYAPGAHYQYDNLGFGLLGIALARRAGMSYEQLLVERVCDPLGLAHTRITPTGEMQRHLMQDHDLDLKPFPLWQAPAMPGLGSGRSTASDLATFLKACLGLSHTPLSGALARLTQTRGSTTLAGTDAALAWFVTSDGGEEIVWKSGLSNGCNSFIGYSPQRRRGAIVLSNFIWRPIDSGTINIGMKAIKPDFHAMDFTPLYLRA
ncbi:MAG TPA: serine hydrolase domain-containing protein, partial [Rhizomicrobium sp.]